MATTYGERKGVIAEITSVLAVNRKRLADIKNSTAQVKAVLDNVPVSLKQFIDDIAADANSGNPAHALMQAEALILLDEAAGLSVTADAMVKALDGIG